MAKKVQLCNVMQGVQFSVNDEGRMLKAVILKEALEKYFGASSEPEDWIRAYRQHQAFINDAALSLHHLQPIWPVVVLRGHEPQLRPHSPVNLGEPIPSWHERSADGQTI